MAETVQVTKPAPFIEAAGVTLTEALTPLLGQTIDTSKFAPKVAVESALQQRARGAATGIESLAGPTAYKQFMSPYQQEVIQATQADLARQRAKGLGALSAGAIGAGAFGGARAGIQRAEYEAARDISDAQLLAGLRQQGFQSAQQQALAQLEAQKGIGQYQTALGQAEQAQQQAVLDAQAQAAREAAFEPYTRTGFVSQQLASLIGGFPAQATQTTTPPPSPLQTALGLGTAGAGILGSLGYKPFG